MSARKLIVLTVLLGGMAGAAWWYMRGRLPWAQYVKITRNDGKNTFINISEMGVYGADGTLLKATPSMSSSLTGMGPAQLVDGVATTIGHTSGDATDFIQLDIGRVERISRVVIRNRVDCCQDRMIGTTVSVLDANKQPVWSTDIQTAEAVYDLPL
jgi:hypothetical protein